MKKTVQLLTEEEIFYLNRLAICGKFTKKKISQKIWQDKKPVVSSSSKS
jgi:hypothetical protein